MGDFLTNSIQISTLRDELNALVDSEIKEKVKAMKLFKGLNSEKLSPLFLSFAKNRNNGKMALIKNDNCLPFNSVEERTDYIVSFFKNLYNKPNDDPQNYEGIVKGFLGPNICNSDIVRNSKLTRQESESLETPLTLEELNNSLKKANFRSASRLDGFSNVLIKKCWHLLRIPLLKYTDNCLEKGELTANFRGATIRLIPKKNDPSCLKNWRPISLLSNMYKILSRAINTRLNKIVNRVCSRSQKGFYNSRYTQEVLINV